MRVLTLCGALQACESCAQKLEAVSEANSFQTVEHGTDILTTFRSNGQERREHDFVYVVDCELVGDIMSPIIASTSKAMNPYNNIQIIKIIPSVASPRCLGHC
ncbi:hypothetical protein EDD21DRAFT_417926 [Dissophora ornata]|nr:hypothetical protein BGZ58_009080 [Dissophora ornata]KAI8598264.1 hypothetical protein EDD21DRAFT_417926 [Dissophora ornata]